MEKFPDQSEVIEEGIDTSAFLETINHDLEVRKAAFLTLKYDGIDKIDCDSGSVASLANLGSVTDLYLLAARIENVRPDLQVFVKEHPEQKKVELSVIKKEILEEVK